MGKNNGAKAAQALAVKPSNEAQISKTKAQEKGNKVGDTAAKGAVVNGKKSKKMPVKEPTPASSSDEDEDDSEDEGDSSDSAEESASDSDSDSESDDASEADVKPTTAQTNGKVSIKANGSAAKQSESSESSESSDSEDEPVAPKSAPTASVVAAKEESASEDSSEESESDESVAEAKVNGAADPKTAVSGGLKTATSESEAGSSTPEDDSESSDDSSEEEAAPKKRKAEAEPSSVAKKAKTEISTAVDGDTNGQVNLFVGQLSWNIDEEWLTRAFEGFGEITGARVVMDRESGRSRGFGYVDFAKPEDAAKALTEMNGTDLDGRKINVDFAGRKDNKPENARGRADSRAKNFKDEASPPSDVLFVGNIAFEATEDLVSEAFGKFATVHSVRLPTDPESGELKGFGYVQFGSIDDATAAYDGMRGGEICGSTIRLDYSKPRVDNGGSRGGRGGGRGFGGGVGGGRGRGGDRGGRGGGRGRGGFGVRGGRGGGRGGRGDSRNRGGFGDYQGTKKTF